jgi:predicted transcriptional regulator
LPSIYTNLTRNEIDSLVIITNNVYADVKNNDYRLLKNEFFGTFVKWEMNTSVISIKNNYE